MLSVQISFNPRENLKPQGQVAFQKNYIQHLSHQTISCSQQVFEVWTHTSESKAECFTSISLTAHCQTRKGMPAGQGPASVLSPVRPEQGALLPSASPCNTETLLALPYALFGDWRSQPLQGFLFVCLFCLFWTASAAYGGSQARGWIRAAAAGLRCSHQDAGSQLRLRPTPQLMATPGHNPLSGSRDHTEILMDTSRVLSHNRNSQRLVFDKGQASSSARVLIIAIVLHLRRTAKNAFHMLCYQLLSSQVMMFNETITSLRVRC